MKKEILLERINLKYLNNLLVFFGKLKRMQEKKSPREGVSVDLVLYTGQAIKMEKNATYTIRKGI